MPSTAARESNEAQAGDLINHRRLEGLISARGLDAIVAIAPENTFYLSGVFIRTQVSIRDRVAVVIWPASSAPTLLVCNIEESLARSQGSIADVETYVEFADQPMEILAKLIRSRGLDRSVLGIESRYLSVEQMSILARDLPDASLRPIDGDMDAVRSSKTAAEIANIAAAYELTERAIASAWGRSAAGDTERTVANRMTQTLLDLGSDGIRHLTLAVGENTIHPHGTPGDRRLRPGDTVLTDVGAYLGGFASDMARMGVVGTPNERQAREYSIYREAYVDLVSSIEPGMRACDAYTRCRDRLRKSGYDLALPHVGHGVSRRGGHEYPMLEPRNAAVLEPGMLLAVEPGFRPRVDQRYHIEDLVLVTDGGAEVLTDVGSTSQMITIQA
jgi:Xaa-Pro dipeptidase